jgi:hypothetical protein
MNKLPYLLINRVDREKMSKDSKLEKGGINGYSIKKVSRSPGSILSKNTKSSKTNKNARV